jgi:hypothetical protein
MAKLALMDSEDLVSCIEKAFGGLDRPSHEELAAEDDYMDQSFIDGVGSLTWQELRPLRDFVGDGIEIVLMSPKGYQYYLPAYLIALVDEPGEEFYLNGVLDSVWYETGLPSNDSLMRDHFDPCKGLDETLREVEIQMPYLTDQARKAAAETRVEVAAKLAYVTAFTGHDFFDPSHLRAGLYARWQDRMPLLTDAQKKSIARLLLRILERTTDPFDGPHLQAALDGYWRAFLETSGDR